MEASAHDSCKDLFTISTANSPTSTLPPTANCDKDILQRRYRWRPTFWRIRPLLGILALVITIVCLLVSLAILRASNGDTEDNWYFQPTVYLAIATAVSNSALQCSLALAAPVSWWYKALRGSTVKDLELEWEAGQSFPRAFINSLKYGRLLSILSVASLATSLVLVDGPLLPMGFSAVSNQLGFAYTPAAIMVFSQHVGRKPIVSNTYCDGTCHGTITAPGYTSTDCWHQSWPINKSMLRDPNSTWGLDLPGRQDSMRSQPLVYSTAFPASTWCDQEGKEGLVVSSGIAHYHDCDGQFNFTNCTLLPAILEYDITIQHNTITYDPPSDTKRVVAIADNYCNNNSVLATVGFTSMMQPYVTANGSLGFYVHHPEPGEQYPIEAYDTQTFNSFSMSYLDITPGNEVCTVTTRDPWDDIVASFNDLMFRSGVYLGSQVDSTSAKDPTFPTHQSIQAELVQDLNIYHSDFRWFVGAAAVQMVTILLILPAYWGWWKIGVELTLSPFHTAKALNAPFLGNVNSAAGSKGIIDEVGEARLQLGAVSVGHTGYGMRDRTQGLHYTRVGLDNPAGVARPSKGARFAL